MSDDTKDEGVGYRRPPRHSQFRPGQSGNPSGRPKGRRNIFSDLSDELSAPTVLSQNGRQYEVSKQVAVIKTLVAAAMSGDLRAVNTLLAVCARMPGDPDHDQT